MLSNVLPSRVLKVWWVQAANVAPTVSLIEKLKSTWPLSVVLSAPNSEQFRTTNVLVQAAQACAEWNGEEVKRLLLSVQEFILETVCQPISDHPQIWVIEREITQLFVWYMDWVDVFLRKRSATAPLYSVLPEEHNDHTASLWRRWNPYRLRNQPQFHSMFPFIELGENISAIIYSHLTGGQMVRSRDWMGKTVEMIQTEMLSKTEPIIISGALRMSAEERMLRRFWRGYSDANAGRLAVFSKGELLVHKEFPVCTADPRVVNGSSQPIPEASMETLRASLHPFVGAQFLNQHVFAEGEPVDIQVGDFSSSNITRISQRDIPDALPLIQKGPRLQQSSWGASFWSTNFTVNWWGDLCLVSVVDHSPKSEQRRWEIQDILGLEAIIETLNDRVASVLVPYGEADEVVRRLHNVFCQR